jgi:hypothetical protein
MGTIKKGILGRLFFETNKFIFRLLRKITVFQNKLCNFAAVFCIGRKISL